MWFTKKKPTREETSISHLNLSANVWERAADYVEFNSEKSHIEIAELMRHIAGGLRLHEGL